VNWLSLVAAAVEKIPFERLIAKPRDSRESLEELKEILDSAPRGKPQPKQQEEELEEEAVLEPRRAHLPERPSSGVSTEETVAYQNREIGKLLLRLERHYAQKLRINGVPCDCGQSKHLLDLESLAEETVPMVDNPQIYYRIIEWVREVGPKSSEEAAKSGNYDEEYPAFSRQAREFRKELLGTLDASALFPRKREEQVIVPVVSEQEKEEIREKAHQKIEEVLGE